MTLRFLHFATFIRAWHSVESSGDRVGNYSAGRRAWGRLQELATSGGWPARLAQSLGGPTQVCGLPGREFFRRGEVRTHHLHLVELNGEHWQRYLCFRDALRTDDVARDAYEALKRQLAQLYPRDREAYVEGKREFVGDVIRRSIVSASPGEREVDDR